MQCQNSSPSPFPSPQRGEGESKGDFVELIIKVLALSRSFNLEPGNQLFQFFPAAFRAFRLLSIVLSDT
jgi:hypothetical protein